MYQGHWVYYKATRITDSYVVAKVKASWEHETLEDAHVKLKLSA